MGRRVRPAAATAVSALVLLAACAGSDAAEIAETVETVEDYPDRITREIRRLAAAPRPVENSAMPPRHLDTASFPVSLVDREAIVSGGPPPDGITPIDEPRFESLDDVDWLGPDEAVLALVDDDGRARAYPVRILIWHEIVNDEFGGVPVSVTYCPLCSSGVAFDRRVGDEVLDFGTSGALYQANLVMYDRQTESLWTQFDGRAVVGDRVGDQLTLLPVATVTWSDFADLHPDGEVLSQRTGFDRPYGTNPYTSYESRDEPVAGVFQGDADATLPAYERVVGVDRGDGAVAVRAAALASRGVVEVTVGDLPLTVWHVDGMASPLSGADVADGERIGATEVYVARIDGTTTSFSANGDGTFSDRATGSTWNLLGEAVDGPAAGIRLEAVPHHDTYWFSWATFFVDTVVVPRS